jgi:hypothetical protein
VCTVCDDNLLHRTRIDRGIELDQIAARTCLNPGVVQAIDCGRFDMLPAGIYARAYVRAFATAVGLEAEQTVRQLEPLLPRIDDPLPVLREIARGAAPDWPDRMAEWQGKLNARLGGIVTRIRERTRAMRPDRGGLLQALVPDRVALRALVPPGWRRFAGRRGTRDRARVHTWWASSHGRAARCAAACVDAIVLLLLLGAIVQLTAWTSGADGREVLTVAGEQLAAVWGVLVLVYFVILGGAGGGTLGAVVCRLRPAVRHEPLRLRSILERAMLH